RDFIPTFSLLSHHDTIRLKVECEMSTVRSSDSQRGQDDRVRKVREEYETREAEQAKRKANEIKRLQERHQNEVESIKDTYESRLSSLKSRSKDNLSQRDHENQRDID